VTEAWLLVVGFRPPASKPPCPELGLGSLFVRWYPESPPQGTWYFNHRDVPAPVTRGQVRRLCEAVGEELAETTPSDR
jgi:hypothetical protein